MGRGRRYGVAPHLPRITKLQHFGRIYEQRGDVVNPVSRSMNAPPCLRLAERFSFRDDGPEPAPPYSASRPVSRSISSRRSSVRVSTPPSGMHPVSSVNE